MVFVNLIEEIWCKQWNILENKMLNKDDMSIPKHSIIANIANFFTRILNVRFKINILSDLTMCQLFIVLSGI